MSPPPSRTFVTETPGPRPSGGYSPAVVVDGWCHVSGMGPWDPATRLAVGTTIEEQTAQVMANIEAVLGAAQARLDDVVSASVFLAELERDWAGFDATWRSYFSAGRYPARTTVGAALKGMLVEIAVVARVAG